MKKGTKEWLEAKKAGREALDAQVYQGAPHVTAPKDSTVGREAAPEGTFNTSGIEMPANRGAVRDVRPETSAAVSLEGLKEQGVPVRDESDAVTETPENPDDKEAPIEPVKPVKASAKKDAPKKSKKSN